ncbi:MAG: hypothetical protein PHP00_05185 [Thiotrichaceae bacterium]|nr:hypothetical protein [Thiotrichaceae bacterium]
MLSGIFKRRNFSYYLSLFIVALLSISFSANATLTCSLNRTIAGASVAGTITVDTIGNVTAANITAWNITVTTISSVNFTNTNSVLDLGTDAPTMTATASALTITPIPLATLTSGQTSQFHINIGGFSGQFYGLFNAGATIGGPGGGMPASSSEVFRFSGIGAEQVINYSPPASLNLTCTCAAPLVCSSGAVSAPIGLSLGEKPVMFSKEISVK